MGVAVKPMSLFRRSFLARRPSSLLVCETDGFRLRASVLHRQGGTLVAAFAAQSEALDYKAAVGEVVDQLRRHGWTGTGKAVLSMPGVVSARIDLPVAPHAPRPPLQMQELVRWELEPLLMEHTTLWSVGKVLVGLGYLTEEQAREVLARQHKPSGGARQESRMEMFSLKRFGEVAVEMGLIEPRQIEEALARQSWLRAEGEDIACGWSALPQTEETQGTHPWLAAGVNQGLLQQWTAAFSAHGVKLEALYPVAGCAAALAPRVAGTLVLEPGGGQMVGIRLGEVGLEALLAHESSLNGVLESCLETYHGLTPPEPEILWLAGEGAAELQPQLASVLGRTVQILQPEVGGVSGSVSVGMAGVAAQELGLVPRINCPVPTRGPRIPLRSRPLFHLAAGVVLLGIGLAAAEITLQVRQYLVQGVADKVNARAAELDGAVAQVQQRVDAIKKLKDEIHAIQEEQTQLEAQETFHLDTLPRRAAFLQTLFDELDEVATEEVVLDRLAEEPKKGLVVQAWALSENAAQQFAEALRRGMEPWRLALAEVTVSERVGRLGLPGYAISLRIVDEATAKALVNPLPPAPPQAPPVRKSRRNR